MRTLQVGPPVEGKLASQSTRATTKTIGTFIGLAVTAVGSLAALATVLGFFGSTWWLFDSLANFRFQLLVGLSLCGIVCLMILGRVNGAIFILMAVVNALQIAPLYRAPPPQAGQGDGVRIVSLNIAAGRSDATEVTDWVTDNDVDLAFFLESSDVWSMSIPTENTAYEVLNQTPEDRYYGITALSRSTTDLEQLRYGSTKDPVLRATAEIDDQPIVIYAIHPRSATSSAASEARHDFFEELTAAVKSESDPVIVIGDFNATPWSYVFRDFISETKLVNSQLGHGFAPTWPVSSFIGQIPIDHMLHSPELTTLQRVVGPDLGSDHRPLLVEVAQARG